ASQSVVVSDDDTTPPVIVLGGSSGDELDSQTQSFTWDISDSGSGLAGIEVTITRDDGSGPVVICHTTSLADAVGSFDFNSYGLGEFKIFVSAGNADTDWAGSDQQSAAGLVAVVVDDDDITPPQIVLTGSTGTETDGQNQVFNWNVSDSYSGLASVNVTIR